MQKDKALGTPGTVCIIGGTGLLGAAAAEEFLRLGYGVRVLARTHQAVPAGVELQLGDLTSLPEDDLRALLRGCVGVVFAAGIDERQDLPKPAYAKFVAANVTTLERVLSAAHAVGVRRAVVHGSYFNHLARRRPELELGRWHPYVRSRLQQAELALSYAEKGMDVAVLELPYIFGVQQGRRPVWAFLVKILRRMPLVAFWSPGGTAAVTVRQVAQATVGALERNRGGHNYPIGWVNLTWTELLGAFHRHLGHPRWRVVTVPVPVFSVFSQIRDRVIRAKGFEPGLVGWKLAELMSQRTYIDAAEGSVPLGVTHDDVDAAIGESVRASLDALAGRGHWRV